MPVVCLPGAGASVTAFVPFAGKLGERWPIYGLQPRGVDALERPHATVEEAAQENLAALHQLSAMAPVHLIGHSRGGLIAFEMAMLLEGRGHPPASLTLIDCEPPESADEEEVDMKEEEIRTEFVEVFENTYGKSLSLAGEAVTSGPIEAFLGELHAALKAAHCGLPGRSPEILRGSFEAFAAARRSRYRTTACYPHKMRLILARDPCLREDRPGHRNGYVAGWRRYAVDLEAWPGSGNHFSMLQPPHVDGLAMWWRCKVGK